MSGLVSDLRRDSTCRRDLLWRCDLLSPVAIDALESAMAKQQYHPMKSPSVLIQWRHQTDDHVVLYVPATGRVQLRLGGFTPRETRVASAVGVFEVFSAAVVTAHSQAAVVVAHSQKETI